MTDTITPTLDSVYGDIRQFVLSVIGLEVPVIQGLGNRVPMPKGPFVLMTAIGSYRLATNVDTDLDGFPTGPGTTQYQQSTKLEIQLDFYGPQANSWATMIGTLWRDAYACNALTTCQPLYADNPRMMPMVTAEAQFLERWTVTAAVQYNPVTSTPQDFFATLNVVPVNVDVEYKP